MPELLHPGVYVQEVPSQIKSIEGVSTSTAAFVGVAERGPVGKATLVTSFREYRNRFGGFIENSFLTYSVLNFFENGGNKCYIVRVVGEGAKSASVKLCDRERIAHTGSTISDIYPSIVAEPIIIVKASSPGLWGNNIDVEIQDDTTEPENLFKIIVKLEEDVVETWGGLCMSKGNPNYIENVLGPGQSKYIEVERIESETTATPGVLLSNVLDDQAKNLSDPNDPKIPILKLEIVTTGTAVSTTVQIEKANNGKLIAESIQKNVIESAPSGVNESDKIAFEEFRCIYVETKDGGRYILVSGFEGKDSEIEVVQAQPSDTQIDVGVRLKLLNSQETRINGQDLQCGTSISENEPLSILGNNKKISFNLNQDGIQIISLEDGLSTGDTIADDIQSKIRTSASLRKQPNNQEAYEKFEASYSAQYLLTFGEVSANVNIQFTDANLGSSLRINKLIELKPSTSTVGRTLLSDSIKNQRPISSFRGENPRTLVLQYQTTGDFIDLQVMDFSEEFETGKTIAEALQEKLRELSNHLDDSNNDEKLIIEALHNIDIQYEAYYSLKSTVVRTSGETGKIVGPISSVEILPYSNQQDDAAIDLKLGLTNGGKEQNGSAMLRPEIGEYHLGDHSHGGAVTDVESGDDGMAPKETDYTGNNGIKTLDIVDDFSLLAVPGMGSKSIVSAGLSYCANRSLNDCFFIADMGSGGKVGSPGFDPVNNPLIDSRDKARDFVKSLPVKNSYGAIYFPWIESSDPIGSGRNPKRLLPPSGYIAGLYAKTDSTRGVWKAPAGTEVKLGGTTLPPLRLVTAISDTDQDFLNPIKVNVIRAFPAAGTVVWGSRTLSSDSSWRYVPVRRMAIYLRVSIYNGIQWAVFEPNDEGLWSSLRLNINSFMMRLFRDGAFQGSSAKDAFFVKCDSNTTTQDDIDAGVVNILVGFAPLKPAEFVVVKISQKAGQQNV